MIKTKFFLGSDCEKVQTEINDFLNNEAVEYIGIQIGTGLGRMICILIYTEKRKL